MLRFALGLLIVGVAVADPPTAVDAHLAAVADAIAAESAGDHGRVVARCGEALAALPDGPRAPLCASRLARLTRLRDPDGGFAGLRALEAIRASGARDPDAARASASALVAAEGGSVAVRAEALAWLASDDLRRRGDAAGALAYAQAARSAEAVVDEALRREVIAVEAAALARLGRADEAQAALDPARVATPQPRPTVVDRAISAQQADRTRWAAWAVIAAFTLVSAARAWSIRREGPGGPPWGLAPLAAVGAVGWCVSEGWEAGAGRPMGYLVAAMGAVHLLSWRAAAGRGRAGVVVSFAAAAASVAAAWLVFDGLGVRFGADG